MELDERTRESVAAYDAHAREYQEALRLKRPLADVRRFAGFARRHDLVLDVGCGPASDLRLLRDAGLHPVGVDLSLGALQEARMLLPRHPLVQAPLDRLPFRSRSFSGLWCLGGFTHLPRSTWRSSFVGMLDLLARGPVYFSCLRSTADLEPYDDDVLGRIYLSGATEDEIEAMLRSHGVTDLTVEVRPDPVLDRRRPWVVALGRLER